MPGSAPIPTYKLYGDTKDWPVPELLHCESIPERSVMHDWMIRPHRHHDLFQMIYCSRGKVALLLDGTQKDIRGPYVVSVPPLCVHGFEFEAGTEGWVVTLPAFALERFFAPSEGLLKHLDVPHILFIQEGARGDLVGRLFERLAGEYLGGGPTRAIALDAYLTLILVWIVRQVRSSDGEGERGADRGAARLRRFQELIAKFFRDWKPIRFYADQLGITPAHLNNTCRELTGKSALQLVHERVLIEAKRNLVYTEMTVSEAAYSLGFSDPAYFTRFFKKRVGQPPSVFRDAKRAQS